MARPASRQGWAWLTFLHWAYEPGQVQQLLPEGFEVDTFDDAAWVSITPFLMVDFRVDGGAHLPGLSRFPETNVRTYVRGADGRDGLWFFSLEATSLPIVVSASTLYGVPYRWAEMSVEPGTVIRYRSRRRLGAPVGHDLSVRVGPPLVDVPPLDDWLSGRWRAWTRLLGRPCTVPVEHAPWPLCDATVVELEQSLLADAGLPVPSEPPRASHCPRLDVRLGRPQPIRSRATRRHVFPTQPPG